MSVSLAGILKTTCSNSTKFFLYEFQFQKLFHPYSSSDSYYCGTGNYCNASMSAWSFEFTVDKYICVGLWWTDRQTHDDNKYCASIALHAKNHSGFYRGKRLFGRAIDRPLCKQSAPCCQPCQRPITQFLWARCSSWILMPSQQCQSTEASRRWTFLSNCCDLSACIIIKNLCVGFVMNSVYFSGL